MSKKNQKKQPKVWCVYRLDFEDGSKYWGSTSEINKRIKQHQSKWDDVFSFNIVKSDIEYKSDAICLENFYITKQYLEDKSKVRNRFLNKCRLRN